MNNDKLSFNQYMSVFIVGALLLMENIDSGVLNVALPYMIGDFHSSILTLKIAITSYLLGVAIFIPISGWVSNRFGSKNLLLFSIFLFTATSALCATTTSVTMLVIYRLLQGCAGAFMVPVARLILLQVFARDQIVKAWSLIGYISLLGPMIAPILGGFLVTYYHWQFIFWVNIPAGVFALLLTLKFIENQYEDHDGFSLLSFITLALFLGTLCFWMDLFLLEGLAKQWKILLFIIAVFSGVVYYFIERKSSRPVINYKLFKYRTFYISFWLSFIVRLSIAGRAFVLAIYLEISLHLNSLQAGAILLPIALGMMFSRPFVNGLMERLGFKKFLGIINGLSTIFILAFVLIDSPGILMYSIFFINGILTACQFIAINVLYYADVANNERADAVSIATTWQQLCSSGGVICAAIIMSVVNDLKHTHFSVHTFHYTFIMLAIINVFAGFFINKLQSSDGENMLHCKKS